MSEPLTGYQALARAAELLEAVPDDDLDADLCRRLREWLLKTLSPLCFVPEARNE